MDITIKSAVICDEVREEKSGKHLLIGVYLADMIVDDFPASIPAMWWVQFTASETAELQREMRIVGDDDAIIVRGEMTVKIRSDRINTLVFPRLLLQLQKPTILSLQWRDKGGDWDEISKIEVRKRS